MSEKKDEVIMRTATRLPKKIKDIKEDMDKYLDNFADNMHQLKEADVNTWQALASEFLITMNNASKIASECYYAKEWYSARIDSLKDELRKREGAIYKEKGIDKLAQTARHNQLKIACGQDGLYMKIRTEIANTTQVVAEFASLEKYLNSVSSQGENAHITARMAGKLDTSIYHKE